MSELKMQIFFNNLFFVLLFITSMYGYGILFLKDSPYKGWAFCASLGIAVCIAIGGILSLFHLTLPYFMLLVFVAGVLIALVYKLYEMKVKMTAPEFNFTGLIFAKSIIFIRNIHIHGILLVSVGFIIFFLMPPVLIIIMMTSISISIVKDIFELKPCWMRGSQNNRWLFTAMGLNTRGISSTLMNKTIKLEHQRGCFGIKNSPTPQL